MTEFGLTPILFHPQPPAHPLTLWTMLPFLQPTPASCSTVFSRPIHPLEVFPSPSSQCSRRRDAHTLPLDSPFFQPNPTLFPSTNFHPYNFARLDSSTVYPSPRGWSGDHKANTAQLYAPSCSPQRSISPNPPALVREGCVDGVGTQNAILSNCSSAPAHRKRTVHACSKCRERKSKVCLTPEFLILPSI